MEEIVLKRAEAKLKLTETVIESGQFSLGIDKDKTSLITDDNVKVSTTSQLPILSVNPSESGYRSFE